MTKKTYHLLVKSHKKERAEMIQTFSLNTVRKICKPSAHDNSAAKGRKWGNKNIITITVRYYLVIKR